MCLLLTLTGCALSNPERDKARWERELDREISGEKTIWIDVDHPVIYGYAGGGPGEFSYRNRARGGTDEGNANLYRFGFIGPASLLVDWMSSTDPLGETETKADWLDIYFFGNRPLWPNRRLRFNARPGIYFDKLNLKKAQSGDAEPWTLGFRFELEAEVDVIKAKQFNLSLFGNGRVGGGWGRTKVSGNEVSSNSWGYGYEAGLRAQFRRFVGSISWLDRRTQLGGDPLIEDTEYRFQGATLMFGLRW